MVELAVDGDRALRPELADRGESLLEDRATPLEVETEGRELPLHALLGVADTSAEYRAPAGDLIERRPLERQIEGVASR